MQITENVYLVPNVAANPYLIVDPDGLTLIDTGMPRSHGKILDYIGGLGKSAHDLKRILLTHSDIDHIGGLAALQQASGARTYASQIEADAIAVGKASREIKGGKPSLRRVMFSLMRPFFKATPVKVDEILTDGQVLPVLGGLRVLATPGHTPGHVSFFAPSNGFLFCGDFIVSDPDGLQVSRPALSWDLAQAQQSARRQAALGARFVGSGHGPVVADAQDKFPKV